MDESESTPSVIRTLYCIRHNSQKVNYPIFDLVKRRKGSLKAGFVCKSLRASLHRLQVPAEINFAKKINMKSLTEQDAV